MKKRAWIAILTAAFLCVAPLNASAVTGDLAWAVEGITGRYDPFTASTEAEKAGVKLTQACLLTRERGGEVVRDGINGETHAYNGKEYTYSGVSSVSETRGGQGRPVYDIALREGVRYSDGTEAVIDDVIFAMYVIMDPAYPGRNAFSQVPAAGVKEYRYGANASPESSLAQEAERIRAGGYSLKTADESLYWKDALEAGGVAYAEALANLYASAYPDVCARLGGSPTACAMFLWDFAQADAKASRLTGKAVSHTWKISEGEYPEPKDLWNCLKKTFMKADDDIEGLYKLAETVPAQMALMEYVDAAYILKKTGEAASAVRITGIERTGTYTMRLTLESEYPDIWDALAEVPVVPAAYYGDGSGAHSEEDDFGFPKGDLSCLKKRAEAPVGAGPYMIDAGSDGELFIQNPYSWQGPGVTGTVELVEKAEGSLSLGILSQAFDVVRTDLTAEEAEAVKQINGNESLDGEAVLCVTQQGGTTGYLAVSRDRVRAGADDGGRLCDVFASLFEAAFAQVGDRDIYTPMGDREGGFAKAVDRAKEELASLGYKADGSGRFTSAPNGASLTYTYLCAGGYANPVHAAATIVSAALAEMGITLNIRMTDMDGLLKEKDQCDMYSAAGALPEEDRFAVAPLYSHNTAWLFSMRRINRSTLPQDMTDRYDWTNEIGKLAVFN